MQVQVRLTDKLKAEIRIGTTKTITLYGDEMGVLFSNDIVEFLSRWMNERGPIYRGEQGSERAMRVSMSKQEAE